MASAADWLVGRIEGFAREAAATGAMVWRVGDEDEARARIVALVREAGAREVVCAAATEIPDVAAQLAHGDIEVCVADESVGVSALRARCAAAEVGIGPADHGIVESGTIVLVHGPAHPRSISLLPPVHIAVLRASALVTDLHELFEGMHRDGYAVASAITFVTGPSRTADIEMILTRGVHGPRELHVVLIES